MFLTIPLGMKAISVMEKKFYLFFLVTAFAVFLWIFVLFGCKSNDEVMLDQNTIYSIPKGYKVDRITENLPGNSFPVPMDALEALRRQIGALLDGVDGR